MLAVRQRRGVSAALLVCATAAATARAADGTQPPEEPAHRVSLLVAPIGHATFTGDFGPDNPRGSDSTVTDNAAVFAASARYAIRVHRGLDLGVGLEFIKPYREPSDDDTVPLRINALNATIFVRPYLLRANRRLELAIHGRLGVTTGFWGSSLLAPGWTLGGGPDVRVALNAAWALGAELSLSAFQIREGGATASNASLTEINAVGFAVLPLLSVTHAF